MKESIKTAVRQILTDYLEENQLRKTPERFAVLDAVYSLKGFFSLQQLNEKTEEQDFVVSRATLYNTLSLLERLRLVSVLPLPGGTKYVACYGSATNGYQVCTVCETVSELKLPKVNAVIEDIHLKRFHLDRYSLVLYGMCSTCRARLTREMNKQKSKNKK